jgi:hypothetical protein
VRERCAEPSISLAAARGSKNTILSRDREGAFVKFYAGFSTFVRRRELPDNRMAKRAVLRIRGLL